MIEVVRPTPYQTDSIRPEDPASGFHCGKHPLDDFFARHALDNDRQGLGKTYVLRDGDAVLGFYTLSMADVEAEVAGRALKVRLPRYPLPVALLGRLAVHQDSQGKGIGAGLLRDALRRVNDLADQIGCLGVIVDAKDEDAERFYAQCGFVAVAAETWPHRMFIALGTIRAAVS
jgi:GNAT superfamily N-acetyltransferase